MLFRRTPLQTFLAVVDHGSVHEAARQLHLSQPSITRQIKALEEELGGALFIRGVQGMTLTRFGETFLFHARRVDQTWRYAEAELSGLASGRAGSLRIGVGPAWAYTIVPDAVAELQHAYPGLRVEMVTRMSEYYRMLEVGQLDMLVAELPRERLPGFTYERVLRIQRFVFARSRHPLAETDGLPASELLRFPWITYLDSIYGPAVLSAYFHAEGLQPPDPAVATSTFQSGFRLMRRSDYLMMLPGTIRGNEAEWDIRPLRLRGTLRSYDAGMIYRPELLRIRPYADFRNVLVATCRTHGLDIDPVWDHASSRTDDSAKRS